MDTGIFNSIADDLGVTPGWLDKVLENHNAKLTFARKYFPVIEYCPEDIMKSPIVELYKYGIAPKTVRRMVEALQSIHRISRKDVAVSCLGDYNGNLTFSQLRMIRGIGTTTLLELKILFDHVGFKYVSKIEDYSFVPETGGTHFV